jgi:hypothetical protein
VCIQEMIGKVKKIRERLKAAWSWQKSYEDNRRVASLVRARFSFLMIVDRGMSWSWLYKRLEMNIRVVLAKWLELSNYFLTTWVQIPCQTKWFSFSFLLFILVDHPLKNPHLIHFKFLRHRSYFLRKSKWKFELLYSLFVVLIILNPTSLKFEFLLLLSFMP